MAGIDTEINNIQNAIYGKDVRNSIVNALLACYSDVNNPTLLTTGIESILTQMVASGRISMALLDDLGLLTETPTTNLFDFATIEPGRLNTSTGAVDSSASGYFVSDYIPVTASTAYYFANTDRRVLYNSSKVFSSNISNASTYTPAADGYIRISFTTANRKTAKVNAGSNQTYRPGRSAIDYNLRDAMTLTTAQKNALKALLN